MTRKKLDRLRNAPRRLLGSIDAAAYVGVPVRSFKDLVARELLPLPKLVGAARRWDIEELDVYSRGEEFERGAYETVARSQAAPLDGKALLAVLKRGEREARRLQREARLRHHEPVKKERTRDP